MSDARGPPDACPKCGGDVVEAPVGWVCDDCGSKLLTIRTDDVEHT